LEKGWLEGKLKSLDLSIKKSMIESELETLSIVKQCEMLSLSRSSLYYSPTVNENIENRTKDIKSLDLSKAYPVDPR